MSMRLHSFKDKGSH